MNVGIDVVPNQDVNQREVSLEVTYIFHKTAIHDIVIQTFRLLPNVEQQLQKHLCNVQQFHDDKLTREQSKDHRF